MPPDGVRVHYTDSLVERRDEPLDQGFEGLRWVVTPAAPEVVCRLPSSPTGRPQTTSLCSPATFAD